MNILGVGPSELLFIVVIALIILGPRDMQKAGRSIGRWLRRVTTSDGWKLFQQTSNEIQTLPNRLMREAALDELKEVQTALNAPIVPSAPAAGLPNRTGQSMPASAAGSGNEVPEQGVAQPNVPPVEEFAPAGREANNA